MREADEQVHDLNELSGRIVGAAIKVHREQGPGFKESAYESSLAIEMKKREIRFKQQPWFSIYYEKTVVGGVRLDFLIEDKIVVEIKAIEGILPIHRAQVWSYLKVTNTSLGLLLNFNSVLMKDGIERIARTH